MKQILLAFFAVLLSVSTCQKKVEQAYDHSMIEYADTLSQSQLDSLFIVDSLSFNINDDWIPSGTISENRDEVFYKYVFIKELTDSTGVIYTLCSYQDTLYIINKRVVK